MAKLAYMQSSASPLVKKFKLGNTAAFATLGGVPALVSQTASAGIAPATTTGGVDFLGMSLDTGTYTTTQSASMVEGQVSLVTNADAIYSWLMSGTAASGGALNLTTNSAASAGGTLITITTGDVAPNGPTMLDGVVYGISGNNTGLSRKITAVAATTATVAVPFPFAIAVGDTFILSPFSPGGLSSLGGTSGTLTTTLEQVRGDIASTTTGFAIRSIDVQIDYQGTPRTTSAVLGLVFDSVWALNT